MTRSTAVLPAVLYLAMAPTGAQTHVSSPQGYLNKEGAGWFYVTTRRIQTIDASHAGKDLTIRSLALRRDERSPGVGAMSLSAVLKVGVNANIHHVVDEMNANFSGPPTTVFNGQLSWPPWAGGGPGSGPFKFDVVYPFTSSYVYRGSQNLNLVWDLDLTGNPFFRRFVDQAGLPSADWKPSLRVLVGNGCTGFSHTAAFWNNGPGAVLTGLSMNASGGTFGVNPRPKGPVLLAMDTQTTPVNVPGWCGTLYVRPNLLIPIGGFVRTDVYPSYTSHSTLTHMFSVPYSPSLEGVTIYSQMITTNQNTVWLSNATKSTIERQRATGAPDGLVSLSTPNTYPFNGFGIVTRLGL